MAEPAHATVAATDASGTRLRLGPGADPGAVLAAAGEASEAAAEPAR